MTGLARQGFLVLTARVGAALAAFGLVYVVARELGAKESGVYYLAISVGTITAVLGRAGLDLAMLRFMAEAVDVEDRAGARGLYRRALATSAAWAAGLSLVILLSAPILSDLFDLGGEATTAIRLVSFLIPIQAILHIHLQVLNGLGRPVVATTVSLILPPAVAASLILFSVDVSAADAVVFSAIAAAIGTATAAVVVRRALPVAPGEPHRTLRELMTTAGPLFVVSSLTVALQWTDIVVLGIFRKANDVGIYAPAVRVSILISLVLVALNAVAGPRFAVHARREETPPLEKLARQVATLGGSVALPATIVLFIWAPQVMGIFGAEFDAGATSLRILVIGQLVNVGSGSVGYALSMAGLERLLQRSAIIVSVGNLLLNLLLVPPFGMEGAAVATAVSLAGMNALNIWWVRSRLHVQPLPFLPPVNAPDGSFNV